jgi:hypothetical protein
MLATKILDYVEPKEFLFIEKGTCLFPLQEYSGFWRQLLLIL